MHSKTRLLMGVVLVLAAALLLFRYFGNAADDDSVEPAPTAEAPEDVGPHPKARDGVSIATRDDDDGVEGEEGEELDEESPEAGYEDHPSIRQYKAITRYPSSTRRLTTDSTDLLEPNKRHERRQPVPDARDNEDRAWEVLHTANRYFVRGEEAVTISLALWHEGDPVLPTGVAMVAAPRGTSASAGPVPLSLERVGSEVQASFVPNQHWPDYIGELEVTTRFGAPGLREQTGQLRFFFTGASRIPGRFTGEYSDEVRAGDLVIEVGVDVTTAGAYRIEGNLFDRDDQPVAWAQAEAELAQGPSVMSLVFYGLAFHDAGAVAPFTLRQLRGYRLRRGDVPHREDMPTYEGEYETSARYSLADFRSDDYQSPHKRRMLERYRDAIERGVVLTEPEFVGDGRQR